MDQMPGCFRHAADEGPGALHSQLSDAGEADGGVYLAQGDHFSA